MPQSVFKRCLESWSGFLAKKKPWKQNKRVAIYTAIFGGRDSYSPPPPGDYDRFLFTDTPVQDSGVSVTVIPTIIENPRRTARLFKLLPQLFLRGYDYTIWMDGNTELKNPDIEPLLACLGDTNIVTFRHHERNCIYDEAEECIRLDCDDPSIIRRQISGYRAAEYPPQNGLAETMVVIRRMTPSILEFNTKWWQELSQNSLRDQLSFNYVLWTTGIRPGFFEGNVEHNPFFILNKHKI